MFIFMHTVVFKVRKDQTVVGSFKNGAFTVAAVVIVVIMSCSPLRYVINFWTDDLPIAKFATGKH
jgi:hypothetical protein